MQILFTKSNSILSRLIRKVTREPVSHCAIANDQWVIHSNLYGVHVELSSTFNRHTEVVYSVNISDDRSKLMSCLARNEQKFWDVGAALYLGLRCLIPILPKKNLWQSSNMYLCTEWVTEVVGEVQDSEITPYKLYLWLESKQKETNK
jgi:hypothetical protein